MLAPFFLSLAAATVSLAQTPAGFEPASRTDLIVLFGNIAALSGSNIAQNGKPASKLRGGSE